MRAACILFRGVNDVTLAETDVPAPAEHEVVVETLYSGVSPGTELRSLAGRQDHLGADHFPFIPGYALVGRVREPDARGVLRAGQLVFCSGTTRAAHRLAWGGHVSLAVLPAVNVVPLPASIDPAAASLLKLAAIAHRGLRLTPTVPGETVVVVGLGPIGQLSARLFAGTGARVIAVDVVAARVAVAQTAGLEARVVTADLSASLHDVLPQGADVVVDATGAPRVLRASAELVRLRPWQDTAVPGGRLILQGSYSGDVPFPQDVAFSREMTVVWPRDCQRDDLTRVVELMETQRLRCADLLGAPVAAGEAPAVYERLRREPGGLLTTAFQWNLDVGA